MLSIGRFAGHCRVSVSVLRHYGAIGLQQPARVDPVTGVEGPLYEDDTAITFAELPVEVVGGYQPPLL